MDFLKAIAKQIEDLLVKYPQAEELFSSKAKIFKVLFDEWKSASDNQPRPYSDPSGSNGKDGYEYDKDDQMWSPIQTQKLPPDPALWEIEDKLCCHYVTLGIIRDMIYADMTKPIVKDILQGTEAKTDAFSFMLYFIENANHKVYFDDSIELALSQVKQDLAKKPAEAEPQGKNGGRNYIDELVRTVIKQRDILITAINEYPPESPERYKAVQRVSPRYIDLPDMWGYAIKQASKIGQLSILAPLIEDLQKAHKNLIDISSGCTKMSGQLADALHKHCEAINKLINYLPAVESASQTVPTAPEKSAGTGRTQQAQTPPEIELIEQIVARLKQWTQKHPHAKRIKPLDFHDVCYGLKVELESATDGLNDILFYLRENGQTGKAEAIEKLYGQLLHGVSAEYHRRSDGLAPMWLELDCAKKAASLLVKELQSIKRTKTEQIIAIGFMSAADLAKHYGVDTEALRKRLDRHREKHTLDTNLFIESQDRGRNKPKYLYNTEMVLHIIEELKSKEASIKRPSEKK